MSQVYRIDEINIGKAAFEFNVYSFDRLGDFFSLSSISW